MGGSIVATIASGGTIVLATGTHLHGAPTVNDMGGNATLTYASSMPSVADWSADALGGSESHAALAPQDLGGALPRWDAPALDLVLSHRPWH